MFLTKSKPKIIYMAVSRFYVTMSLSMRLLVTLQFHLLALLAAAGSVSLGKWHEQILGVGVVNT